jgi:3-methyladenine DNA glycosylase AlkD
VTIDDPTVTSLVSAIEDELASRHDPAKAPAMAGYMRDQFAFLGVASPGQVDAYRAATAGLPRHLPEDVVTGVTEELWRRPEREFQYVGCRLANRHAAARTTTATFLPVVEGLISRKPWWDTVDILATHAAGDLVRRHRELRPTMDAWLAGDDLWLTRAALLHMNRWKAEADQAWLFAACLHRADHPDFFIRKAIGWALREHSKTDPAAVTTFVDEHRDVLSGLSRREAMAWLERRRQRAGDISPNK